MKKFFKKAIALALSVVLSASCFGVIPALAGSNEGVTLLDSAQTFTTRGGAVKSYSTLAAMFDAKSPVKYGTQLKTYGVNEAYAKNLFSNLAAVKSITTQPYGGEETDISSHISNLTNGETFESANSSTKRYTQALSSDVVDNGLVSNKWDLDLTMELKSEMNINSILLNFQARNDIVPAQYKLYIGSDRDTLYTDSNVVVEFDAYELYSQKNKDEYKLNAGNLDGGTRLGEAQHWQFTDALPKGKYIGMRVYDAQTQDNTSGTMYMFYLYEFAAYSVPNVTIVDNSSDTLGDKYVSELGKINYNSNYPGTKLKIANINNAYMAETFDSRDNMISAIEYRGSGAQASNLIAYNADQLNGATDKRFIEHNGTAYEHGGTYGSKDMGDRNVPVDIILTLSERTKISDIYMFGHISTYNCPTEYKIYVGDDKDTLFSDANEVAYYDVKEALTSTGDGFNTTYSSGPNTTKRSEGQIWTYADKTDIVGNYVGIQILAKKDKLIICDYGVFGTVQQETKEYTVTYMDGDAVVSTQTVVEGADAIAPANPTKEGYTFKGWDYDGKNITKDTVINAVYEINKYTVTFMADGKTVDTQTINWGEDAVAPADPEKEGYTFTGWDVAFNNVTSNLTVTAQFAIKTYTVTFMADGKLVEEVQVDYGKAATAPAAPAKEGYTFVRWDADFSNVTDNLTVNAVYEINKYTVTYVADGVTVDTQTVEHGSDATAPEAPAKEGYTFVAWDNDGKAIKADTTITATYEINTYTVTFKADDKVLKTETVEYGAAATAPAAPAKLGYTFAGWDVAFDKVVEDIEVNAVYDFAGYVVTFESAAGVVLGELVVADGQIPDINEVRVINEKVANIYGYEIAVNEAGDVIWDKDVYAEGIVSNITVRPFYEAKDINTAVTIYKLDNKTEYEKHGTQKYDTAIELVCEGANSWVDENGNVLLDTAEGTLYACGSRMKLYPVSEQKTAPAVAVVGKVNDGDYSVFAHVNVENATAYGVVFSSSTGYTAKNDFTVEDVESDATGKRYKMVEIDASKVGQVDFMATLEGTGDKTRYARAYVVVGGQYYYTNAVCNK